MQGRATLFGQELRRWRLDGHLTQLKAAKLLGVGMATWSEWEASKTIPVGIEVLMDLEELTGIHMETTSTRRGAKSQMLRLIRRRLPLLPGKGRGKAKKLPILAESVSAVA